MIRSFQIRAGRALLGWSAADLAKAADVSQASIARAEQAEDRVSLRDDTLISIIGAFRGAGVDFVKKGEKIGVVLDTGRIVP